METMLLIVTIVSLTLALVTSLLAWRMMRDERMRSAARVAALAADLRQTGESTVRGPRHDETVVADTESTVRDLRVEDVPARDLPLHEAPVTFAGGMFGERPATTSRFRLAAVVAAGALVVATVIGTLVAFSGSRDSVRATQPAARAATDVPLELVALAHERQADRLTIRGVVRNPPIGAELNHLEAVVLLFNAQGSVIGSGTAAVDASVAPGAERPFVVSVAAPPDVGRYRVSFRSADHVIPHVDRRS